MPLTVCEPNAWYLVIRCKKCGSRQPLSRDLSQGKSELLTLYRWKCVECQHIHVYKGSEVERYQHVMK